MTPIIREQSPSSQRLIQRESAAREVASKVKTLVTLAEAEQILEHALLDNESVTVICHCADHVREFPMDDYNKHTVRAMVAVLAKDIGIKTLEVKHG